MPVAKCNGIDLHYEQMGEGPRLLFFNGSFSTIEAMRPLLGVFSSQCDTLIHDQRGLGKTEIPPGPYSMADYAADANALLDHIGWDSCRVIGISFGGMVAQEFAVTFGSRVEKLALLCTSSGGAGGSSYPMHELRALPADERAALSLRLMDSRFSPEWFADHPNDRIFAEGLAARPHIKPGSEAERGEYEQAEARRFHDVWDRLDAINCPTFIGAGRYDGISPLQNSENLAHRISTSQLHVYEGGHAFFGQDPKALPDVLEFLTSP